MGVQFSPTETFEAKIRGNNNRYLKGMVYTVYDTPLHEELAEKVKEWEKAGIVEIVGRAKSGARPARLKTEG